MNLLRRTLIASVTPLLALADTTVNATNYGSGKIATVTDANLITTAGEVTVSSGANLTLQAQTRVSLQPGFKAVSGSTFAARIVDLSPVFTSVAAISATVGGNVSFQVAASGNPTSYAATGLPAGLVINGSTGVISGATNRSGAFVVTVTATNSYGARTQTLVVTVDPGITPTASVTPAAVFTGGSVTLYRNGITSAPLGWTENVIWRPDGSNVRLGNLPLGSMTYVPDGGPGIYWYQFRLADQYGNYADQWIQFVYGPQTSPLPYATGYEASEGFVVNGNLFPQKGWWVWTGVANVTTSVAQAGGAGVVLQGGTPRAQVQKYFSSSAKETFLDVYARPVAAATASASSWADFGASRLAFIAASTNQGAIYAFHGDGQGGGVWRDTGRRFVTDANGLSTAWLRLTVRHDYPARTWDLAVDGTRAATDQGFLADTATSLTDLTWWGTAGASAYLDTFSASTENPFPAPTVPANVQADARSVTTLTLSWGISTASTGVTGYEVMLDSVSLGVDPAPGKAVTGLTPGTAYAIKVRAQNGAGFWSAWSSPVSISTLADTDAPTVPAGLTAAGITAGGFNLNWSPSRDDVGVTGYEIYRDGVFAGATAATSFALTGLAPQTTYAVTIRARDGAGNWSSRSGALAVTTNAAGASSLNASAPTVPQGLKAANVTERSLTLSWEPAADQGGIAGYEVLKDGVSLGVVNGTSLVLEDLTPGAIYRLSVRARSSSGGWSAASESLAVSMTGTYLLHFSTWGSGNTLSAMASASATHFAQARTEIESSAAPQESKDAALAVLGQIRTAAAVGTNYNGYRHLTFVSGAAAGSADFARNDNPLYDLYLSLDWPGLSAGVPLPPAPSGLALTASTPSSLTVAWTALNELRPIYQYEIFVDGVSAGVVPGSTASHLLTGLTPGRLYTINVRATYGNGTWSDWSRALLAATPSAAKYSTAQSANSATWGTWYQSALAAARAQINASAAHDVIKANALTVVDLIEADAVLPENYVGRVVKSYVAGTAKGTAVFSNDPAGGGYGLWFTVEWADDTTPPSAPVGLAASNVTRSGFTLTWSPSSDDVGVTGYEVFRNGISLGATATTTFAVTGLSPGTSSTMTVRARDAAGNWSALSEALSVTTTGAGSGSNDSPGTGLLGGAVPANWPNSGDPIRTADQVVGATAGSLQVDQNGAANYSIALWVSPGTAGMEPKLALNYSSQGGSGWLGYGWALSGQTTMTRGGQTLAVDGQVKGLTFSPTDRFYLDGQRLIYIGGGSGYGTNGAEYRTEIDSISKIVSYGSAGSGPAYFKVWTKAGLILELGNSAASAAEAQGRSEIATWAVSKISDTKGNSMTFDYAEDIHSGEQRLTRIDYTGNAAVGLAPYASVRFSYEPRTDAFYGYQAGSKVARTQRIKSIASYVGETLVRQYVLDYTERADTGRSLLMAVHEKGTDGKEYPPLTFVYETPAAGWDQPNGAVWGAPVPLVQKDAPPRGTGFVDLDGDGRPDFVQFHRWNGGDERGAWLNRVTGWIVADGAVPGLPDFRPPAPLATDGATNNDNGNRFVDVNGDGLVDFFLASNGAAGGGRFYRNTGSGFVLEPTWDLPLPAAPANYDPGSIASCTKPTFVDLDGDGRPELLAIANFRYLSASDELPINRTQQKVAWHFDPASGTWQLATQWGTPFDLDKGSRFVDVNCDGLPDQVQSWYGSGTYFQGVALNTGSGWNQIVSHQGGWITPNPADDTRFLPPDLLNTGDPNNPDAPIGTELVDLNGDGLADLITRNDTAGNYHNGLWFNTGNGWVAAPAELSAYAPNNLFALAADHSPQGAAFLDVNGDGIIDAVRSWESYQREVRLGTGRGWSAAAPAYNLVRQFGQGGLPNAGTDSVDLNGDGAIDQVWNLNWNGIAKGAAFSLATSNDRLVTVTNGFGVSASVMYAPLPQRDGAGNFTVYEKGTAVAGSDVANVIGPMWVVKSVRHDDGTGGQYALDYFYGGLRSHRLRGNLGFEWQRVTDSRTGISTKTSFSQTYPYIGMPVGAETKTSGGTVLGASTVTYAEVAGLAAGTHLPYAAQSVESSNDLNGAHLVTTTTTSSVDPYGNVTAITVASDDGYTKSTINTYGADNVAAWMLGRLTQAQVTASAPGVASQTRTSAFTYDAATGLLLTEIVEPNAAALALTTTSTYDAFGNKTTVAVSGAGVTTRTTSTTYDASGRFPVSTTNALGHSESYSYHPGLGVVTQLTGANGLVTTWQYDGFGRKQLETRADGTQSIVSYKWAGADSPAGSAYLVETQTSGAAPGIAFYDSFGRVLWAAAINGDGALVWQRNLYDAFGRTYAASTPYLAGSASIHWTQTTSYDLLNRPLVVQTPDDENGTQTTTYNYNGLSTSVTDPKGRVSTSVKNSQGWTLSNTRNATGAGGAPASTVTYSYDAFGNLLSTNAAGAITTLTYDLRGRKTGMSDPDMGNWTYAYNVFGELVAQTDAKNQTVTLGYDALGRLTTRSEPEGTTTWAYDTAAKAGGSWKGKLASVTAPSGYVETYDYDAYGRPATTWRTIPGVAYSGTEARFFVTQTYDTYGRPATTIYPTQFRTRNVYNDYGALVEVRKYLASDDGKSRDQLEGLRYWLADAHNAANRVVGEIYGNGLINDRAYSDATGRLRLAIIGSATEVAPPYSIQYLQYAYDAVGNVISRNDGPTNRTETFGYDGLDRLTQHALSGAASAAVTVSYDAAGNITNKSDVGAYGYGSRPHAVTTAGANTYTYDANGNMTGGAGRTLAWTSYNQLLRADMTGGKFSEFTFGAAHERVKQVSHLGTTVYVGALFERFVPTSGVTEQKHYIYTPTGRVAVYTERSSMANDVRYFHTDGLGSITAVTNEAGGIVKRFAFDAWGKRVDPPTNGVITSNAGPGATQAAGFTRGYTDHEHLDDLGLIHMNGRVYDPVLGRFLSADPNVDDATDAQGFNRYSYVGNNPMNATDPSGFFKLKDALKIVAVVAAAYFTAGWAISTWGTTMATSGSLAAGTFTVTVTAHSAFGALVGNAVLGGLAGGFASGFAGSLLNGGSIGDAFKAGVIGGTIGAFTAYVGTKIGQGVDDWKNGSQEYYNVRPDPLNPGKMLPPEKILDKTSIRGGVRIFENGMLNPLGDAAKNGAYFYKGQEFILAHNPSHGFIADLTEVTLGKLTGTSSLGRDLAGVLGQIDAAQSTLYMHSQGAQIGFNALAEVGRRGGSLQGLSLKVYGGATNILTSNMVAHSVRANITTWTMNAFDAVPNIAGLNALYAPHRFVTSLLASPFLFAGGALSPHSSSTGMGKTFWSIFNSTY